VNRPDATEQQLTADTIKRGLQSVATALHAKQQDISIIAVGGAVNTLLLHSRASTGDVDFFYRTKKKHDDVTKVIIAADNARKALKLDDNWLNNHTALFIEVRRSNIRFTCAWSRILTSHLFSGGHNPAIV